MAKGKGNAIGSWSFLIGVVLAVIIGLMGSPTEGLLILLVLIGLVVGFMNVSDDETKSFLMSGAVLIIASSFGSDVLSSIDVLGNVLAALLAIFVPATVIVAIKNVFNIARN